ncbi:MAG: Gfo/Idh/MocA family oxidoreductase [Phycisphaerae bacterium]|nr:Gfo/Idh/MocA family oxidoreductase [Phycisphaerae bacterium]
MSSNEPLGLGLLGCGAFGRFCLETFATMDQVRIAAVADIRPDAARALGEAFDVVAAESDKALLARDDVDIVHIAAPPAAHRGLAIAALTAGKHVLCEKPLAVTIADADAILAAADRAGRLCPVNFVLRHNPVTEAVARVLDAGPLGAPLAGRLTNCAFDTYMPPGHWFWDEAVSGGIFVEHGVHFFDMYATWLGAGEVIGAHTLARDGGLVDRVACTVRHAPPDAPPVLVSHYHGFDQIEPMDRAEHRIVCEMGDVRVAGWVPLRLTVDAAVDDAGAERLRACCPWTAEEAVDRYDRQAVHRGRGMPRHVTQRLRLTYEPNADKAAVYAQSLRALLADQVACIRDASHQRRITERNGRDALATAVAARRRAHEKAPG